MPTLVDRGFQQALRLVLRPILELALHLHSYGFRPKRDAHQAVVKRLIKINSGYQNTVDIDRECFFDQVERYIVL
jgi:RNA-directed DNA polymerase